MTFIQDASIKEIKQEVRHLVELHSLDCEQAIYNLSQFFDPGGSDRSQEKPHEGPEFLPHSSLRCSWLGVPLLQMIRDFSYLHSLADLKNNASEPVFGSKASKQVGNPHRSIPD